jgi:HD superfamily phosphohydrolase
LFAIIINHDPNPEKKLLDIVIGNNDTEENDLLLIENFKITVARIKTYYTKSTISGYASFLLDVESAMTALFYLDDLHKNKVDHPENKKNRNTAISNLLVSTVIEKCGIKRDDNKKPFNIFSDAFVLDIIGNTICADLLDYSKRDCAQAGLKYDYDDRLFKYFTLGSYKRAGSDEKFIKLCLQVFTNKLRSDVVTEIITVLRNRYILTERILYHPTKCSAGAMLGCAVYMIGIDKADIDFFRIGDAVFLRMIELHSYTLDRIVFELSSKHQSGKLTNADFLDRIISPNINAEDEASALSALSFLENNSEEIKNHFNKLQISKSFNKIFVEEAEFFKAKNPSGLFINDMSLQEILERIQQRVYAGKKLIWQIQSRQFYKKVFRISKIDDTLNASIKRTLSEKFKNALYRYNFERNVEQEAGLPYGSLVIHCPRYDTSMKGADVLVFGTDPQNAIPFKEIIDEAHELISLSEYVKEAKTLESSYLNVWNMYFFVQQAQMHRWPFIEMMIKKHLNRAVDSNTEKIVNSGDLVNQLRRDYGEPASKLLTVLEFIDSGKCKLRPQVDLPLVQFVETETFHGKKNSTEFAAEIVNLWSKRLADESTDVK